MYSEKPIKYIYILIYLILPSFLNDDDTFRYVEISSDTTSKNPRWIEVDTKIRKNPIGWIIIANFPSNVQGKTNKTVFFRVYKYWCDWSDLTIKSYSFVMYSRWQCDCGRGCAAN